MRLRACLALVLAALAITVVLAARATAEIYRWVDEHGTAHYGEGLQSVPERHRARAVPLGLRNSPAPPPSTRSSPRPPSAPQAGEGVATIQYNPGDRILVDVRLNERTTARLLLDTGADRTLISPRALVAAGVELKRAVARGEMRGVTGSDEVLYVVVDSLAIDAARVDRLTVAAYEMGAREAEGLLGRDFLDRFNVSIDASRGVVTLTPR